MGIFKQTFYMIVAIIVIIIGIFVALTLMRQNEVIMKIVENQAKSLSVSVARVNQDAMVSNNFGTIVENTMALLQNISNISYIIITKGNDLILVHYKNRWEKLENFDPEWKIGDGTKDFGKIIYSDLVKSKVFHYSFQLRYWEMPIGSIYIGLSLDSLNQDRKEMFSIMLFWTFFCIGLGSILAFLFSRRLTQPILALEEVTRRIARGDLNTYVDLSRKDEIQSLALSFNTMTEKLKTTTVSKNYMNDIIQNMNDSLIVLNQKYEIQTVNLATIRLLGYPLEKLINQPIQKIIPENMVNFLIHDLNNMINGKSIFPKESIYLNEAGKKIPVLFSAAAMRDTSENQRTGYLLLALNITEKKETEAALKSAYMKLKNTQSQLIQSGKLASIGELAAGVAHELNQPLMVVRTTAQYFKLAHEKNKFNPDDLLEFSDTLEKNTRRMMNIINHLRTFSRQSSRDFISVNLNQVVEDAFLLISEQLRLRTINVNKNLMKNLPQVLGDPNQLEQVILNLLANSRDAILEKVNNSSKNFSGKIDISTQATGEASEYVSIFVIDNGIGMDESELEKIFDPFYTTKEVGKGTGLGLSISYGIIKDHNGKIEVISDVEKKETIFRISLPVLRSDL